MSDYRGLRSRTMAHDTPGDCPLCGHKESSYDDWQPMGYPDGSQRAMQCVHCRGLCSWMDGQLKRYEPKSCSWASR